MPHTRLRRCPLWAFVLVLTALSGVVGGCGGTTSTVIETRSPDGERVAVSTIANPSTSDGANAAPLARLAIVKADAGAESPAPSQPPSLESVEPDPSPSPAPRLRTDKQTTTPAPRDDLDAFHESAAADHARPTPEQTSAPTSVTPSGGSAAVSAGSALGEQSVGRTAASDAAPLQRSDGAPSGPRSAQATAPATRSTVPSTSATTESGATTAPTTGGDPGGAGAPDTVGAPGAQPTTSPAPTGTEAPTGTGAPAAPGVGTETPEATPAVTGTPAATATTAPVATATPKPVAAASVPLSPTATPAPTATPKPTVAPTPTQKPAPPPKPLSVGPVLVAKAKPTTGVVETFDASGNPSPVRYHYLDGNVIDYGIRNPTFFKGTLYLQVVSGSPEDEFVEVAMPVRPSGTTGWVRSDDFEFFTSHYSIEINISTNTVRVWDGENLVVETAAVTGRSDRPTPIAQTYVDEIIPGPNAAYGPKMLTLALFSESLNTFSNSLPKIAIHGTNQPELMGSYASSGCIRVPNDVITRLADMVPPGTPVSIVR